ncbi:MAG: hypothetical protein ABF264_03165 [Flavobacteriales bacterium]|jgi:hypothetical protein
MENQHFLDQDSLIMEKERPTFLTVLCIITFVVSGIFSLSSIYSALTYDKEAQIVANEKGLEQMYTMAAEDETGTMSQVIPSMEVFNQENIENATVILSINVLGSILSLLGAIMMYQMKKTGFHLYLSSKVISMIPLLFFTLSLPVFITYGFFLFFTIAFVIMYSRNLKHLQ